MIYIALSPHRVCRLVPSRFVILRQRTRGRLAFLILVCMLRAELVGLCSDGSGILFDIVNNDT